MVIICCHVVNDNDGSGDGDDDDNGDAGSVIVMADDRDDNNDDDDVDDDGDDGDDGDGNNGGGLFPPMESRFNHRCFIVSSAFFFVVRASEGERTKSNSIIMQSRNKESEREKRNPPGSRKRERANYRGGT